jgi:hypothetical protein
MIHDNYQLVRTMTLTDDDGRIDYDPVRHQIISASPTKNIINVTHLTFEIPCAYYI